MQIGVKSKFPQQLLSMPASDIHFEQKLWFCVKLAGHFNQQAPTSEYVGSMQIIVPYICPSKEALLWQWNAAITHPPHPQVKIHFTSTLLSMAP